MKLAILVTTYNDGEILIRCIDSLIKNSDEKVEVIVVDDGSTHKPEYNHNRVKFIYLEHVGRGKARVEGVNYIKEKGYEWFIFLDSDMYVDKEFFKLIYEAIEKDDFIAAYLPEIAYSKYTNFITKVKVFERNLYNVDVKNVKNNIEAARLWRVKEFPNFYEDLEAFEEIQPTLIIAKECKKISRVKGAYIYHDEKKVTLKNLFGKKKMYFNNMQHDKVSWRDTLSRFYFFRPQLYHIDNVKKYMRHPLLTIGVIIMYIILTIQYCLSVIVQHRK